ncbi:MAG: EamA family transporter [Verrucomicrobiae bacterium]|nr:EamA family transporter [Verrucomicrobiae bacterium]
MNGKFLGLILFSQICLVAGQLWLKHSMNMTHHTTMDRSLFAKIFLAGIAAMTLWFFLWLGLMRHFDLSYLYPFEGLSPILLVIGANFFLHEKMTLQLWIGTLFISAGLSLVAMS